MKLCLDAFNIGAVYYKKAMGHFALPAANFVRDYDRTESLSRPA